MAVQQQLNVIHCGIFAIAFATHLLYIVVSFQMFHTSIRKCENTCLFVYNEVCSRYFQAQVQKPARQEVLHTI